MQVQTIGFEKFQSFLSNIIDRDAIRDKKIAAIIGESPSKYAKSPTVWNAGFEALGIEAVYLPFDVAEGHLTGLLEAMRQEPRLLGFSVTVPYKSKVIPFLDELDPKAGAIRAVNTVTRTKEGRLIGYNTDGKGGIDALLKIPAFGSIAPFQTLKGKRVLLIGAGGAARALAFYLAEVLEKGKLYLTNRDLKKGEGLYKEVDEMFGNAELFPEKEISKVARDTDLIINATTKGQSGLRSLPDGLVTCLEPYSALAPAIPPSLPLKEESSFFSKWIPAALEDIEKNNRASLETLFTVPSQTLLFDIIYAPLETVFLRQGRWTGHRTLNGKFMNIAQAADAFFEKVVKSLLQEKGLYTQEARRRLLEAMITKW